MHKNWKNGAITICVTSKSKINVLFIKLPSYSAAALRSKKISKDAILEAVQILRHRVKGAVGVSETMALLAIKTVSKPDNAISNLVKQRVIKSLDYAVFL